MKRREFLATTGAVAAASLAGLAAAPARQRLLYIAQPGIRNYQQYGGVGVLVYDIDGGFIMTPMEQGIRVTSGVELTDRDAPSSFAQLDQVVPLARGVAEFGDAVGDVWRGARPTLPDGPCDRRRHRRHDRRCAATV